MFKFNLKSLLRGSSFLLAIVFTFGLINVSAFAGGNGEQQSLKGKAEEASKNANGESIYVIKQANTKLSSAPFKALPKAHKDVANLYDGAAEEHDSAATAHHEAAKAASS